MANKPNNGALFVNDRKTTERQPDYTGTINVNGVEMAISGWSKTARSGTKYVSLAISPLRQQAQPDNSNPFDPNHPAFNKEDPLF